MKHGLTPVPPLFSTAFSNTQSYSDLEKIRNIIFTCVYTRIMFLYRDIGQTTPCRTLGIKIIITLEIGHGGGTLVIFGGHMPAGTKPGERERRRKKEKKKREKRKRRSHT